ncbi:MAG: 3-dehydroquinate synthase [Lachnospiraceae bacterium]|nr:3-dehydroquinate synthase [Lachnospiraceae bacterium]
MRTIRIDTAKSYDVVIGRGLLAEAGTRIRETCGPAACMLVSDDRVFALYGEAVKKSLEEAGIRTAVFTFPHGEASKTLATYAALLEELCVQRITRSDLIVALGGGVTGDLAGFAAATYRRGIPCVQIPTSLLAMVDSSVGGKTAVDLAHGKNMAGAFLQPSLVLCDTDTLSTLPEEEYACGCAEIIKYAMIESEAFFESLERTPVRCQEEEVIAACVDMKRKYVTQDEFDRGVRMFLNFGHTFGHAAEACSGFSILHGQGVAMGMAAVTRAAVKRGLCAPEVSARLEALLMRYGLPTETPYPANRLLSSALSDKKARGGTVSLIVPRAVGRCVIRPVPGEELLSWMTDGGIAAG